MQWTFCYSNVNLYWIDRVMFSFYERPYSNLSPHSIENLEILV